MLKTIDKYLDDIRVSMIWQRTKNGSMVMMLSLKPRYQTNDMKVNHPAPTPIGWDPSQIGEFLGSDELDGMLRSYAEKVKAAGRKSDPADPDKVNKQESARRAKPKAPAKRTKAAAASKVPKGLEALMAGIASVEKAIADGDMERMDNMWKYTVGLAKKAHEEKTITDEVKQTLKELQGTVKSMQSKTLFD